MIRILIVGGTGLIGRHLSRQLLELGYEVALLSRSKGVQGNITSYAWNPEQNIIPREAINSYDCIINLAGENIGAKRWTNKRKELILDSRTNVSRLIFNKLDKNPRLSTYISASAIGYYGATSSTTIFRETDPPADDFLGQTCRRWEEAADVFSRIGVRTVKIRTGIVLSKDGGALTRLQLPAKWGLASALGHGNQYMPWIHVDDLSNIYIQAIKDSKLQGPYNAVAPEHINNRDFTKKVAQSLHRPFWFPKIPALAMKLLFGEMSVMLLSGSRISSELIRSVGYTFLFPELDKALEEIYSK